MLIDFEVLTRSPTLSALAQSVTVSFRLSGDAWECDIDVSDGVIRTGGTPEFTVNAPDHVWHQVLASAPPPGYQSVIHLLNTGVAAMSGDSASFMRHVHLVSGLVDALRNVTSPPFAPARPLEARGEYRRISSAIGTADIHIERCGRGPQLLAFATAGSSITQWHGLMTESDLCENFELITVDLPWHGSSSPTFNTPIGGWRLTPSTYARFIIDATRALELDFPILLGVSMAGAAVIHAVALSPKDYSGAIACQAGPNVRGRSTPLLRSTEIDQSLFVPEWTAGLMNPQSPAEFRKRVWWGYSSGGHGLYAADISSYEQWDVTTVKDLLTESSPHIAVLSGAFDTSVPPALSEQLANLLPRSSFQEMPELGHFPHAENPARFADYLRAALNRVLAR
ncbi:alpha/beta hydrolase [Brevibacterium casei]|uniref:alpha/beta fold hydrolase n=1 Tax=Brevibacterium casei TaxID=33889 RepID=UPI00223B4333|nr:alpha/beta hydrolase [Brevibacterium casei]MCT2182780.1 alpha/beta hydrolase [Brevibacterium casei]